MRKALYVTAGSLAALTISVYGWAWVASSGGDRSPGQLADRALQAPTETEQIEAALALASCKGHEAKLEMQRVLTTSSVSTIRAAMIESLASQGAYEYMTLFLDALDDENPWVRGRAGAAVQQLLAQRYDYHPEDSAAQRAPAIQAMRRDWEKIKDIKLSGSPFP